MAQGEISGAATENRRRDRKSRCRVAAILLLGLALAGCRKSPSPTATEASGATSLASTPTGAAAGGNDSSSPVPAGAADTPSGSLADRLNAVESGTADKPQPVKLPNWPQWPANQTSIQVPLRAGLGITAVDPSRIKDHPGDLPVAAFVEDVSDATLHVHHYEDVQADKERTMQQYQTQEPMEGPEQKQAEVDHREVDCDVTVDVEDLETTHAMRDYVCKDKVEHYPGTEPFGVSTQVLTELRAGQNVDFHFVPDSDVTASVGAVSMLMGQAAELPPLTQVAGVPMFSCTLHRVEPYDLAMPVMLNDEPISLPVLHASCPFPDGRVGNLYLLDELDNPMKMWGNMGVLPETLQVVQIELPPPPPSPAAQPAVSPMEQALAQKKPVEVYGIYFDFNSDRIKPQSQRVLQQIATILKKNPGWKLSVAGHTDNVGDDGFNLDLSKRRAAAVKAALVTQYHIAANRLDTSGYGASRPVASNDTIEGRARNRRVELERD